MSNIKTASWTVVGTVTVLGTVLAVGACTSAVPNSVTVSSAVEATDGLVFSSDFSRREAAVSVVTDTTGNMDGIISSDPAGNLVGASWTTRADGGGDALDITSGHVKVAASSALNSIRDGVTVCARVRARSTSPGWGGIATRQDLSEDAPGADWRETYGLYVNQNTARFVTNAPEVLTLDTAVPLDQWVHLCATYDNTTKQAVGYTNCVADGTATLQGTLNNETNNPLIIGGNHNFGSANPVDENFPGSIDDVRVYNRVLTAAEVASFCAPPVCAPGAAGASCCHSRPDGGPSLVDGGTGGPCVDAGASDASRDANLPGPPWRGDTRRGFPVIPLR